MSYETRVTVVLLAMLLTGWGIGYLQAYVKQQNRLRDAQKRADEAYRRYWNNDERDWF